MLEKKVLYIDDLPERHRYFRQHIEQSPAFREMIQVDHSLGPMNQSLIRQGFEYSDVYSLYQEADTKYDTVVTDVDLNQPDNVEGANIVLEILDHYGESNFPYIILLSKNPYGFDLANTFKLKLKSEEYSIVQFTSDDSDLQNWQKLHAALTTGFEYTERERLRLEDAEAYAYDINFLIQCQEKAVIQGPQNFPTDDVGVIIQNRVSKATVCFAMTHIATEKEVFWVLAYHSQSRRLLSKDISGILKHQTGCNVAQSTVKNEANAIRIKILEQSIAAKELYKTPAKSHFCDRKASGFDAKLAICPYCLLHSIKKQGYRLNARIIDIIPVNDVRGTVNFLQRKMPISDLGEAIAEVRAI